MLEIALLCAVVSSHLMFSAEAPAPAADVGIAARFAERQASGVRSVGFSADGARMLFYDGGTALELWNVGDGTLTGKIEIGKSAVARAAMSGDGKRAAAVKSSARGYALAVWDLDARQELGQVKVKDGTTETALALQHDGARVYTGTRSGAIEGWELGATAPSVRLEGATEVPHAIAVDARGARLVSMAKSGTLRCWDLASGKPAWTVEKTYIPDRWLAFSRDGARVFASYGATVTIFDAKSGAPSGTFSLPSPNDQAFAGCDSLDGKLLAVGTYGGSVLVWDLAAGREKLYSRDTHAGAVKALGFRAKRGFVAFADGTSGCGARVLRGFECGEYVLRPSPKGGNVQGLGGMVFADRGKKIVAGQNGSMMVWDLSGKNSRPIALDRQVGEFIAASPKDALVALAASGREDTIVLADAAKGEVIGTLKGHSNGVYAIAFSSSGKLLVSGGIDGTARVWDVAKKAEVFQAKTANPPVQPIAFNPADRRIYFGDKLDDLHAWDIAAKKETLKFRVEGGLVRQCFAVDGKSGTLATFGNDVAVHLWSPAGKSLASVKAPPGHDISAVAFSADGALLAASSTKGLVLWKGPRWTEKLRIETGLGFGSVRISPDGALLAAVDGMGVHVFRIPK
jgi:WD40 repeat protein